MTVTIPPGYSGAGQSSLRKGVFVEGRTVALNSFYMAEKETTLTLWNNVRLSVTGYTFQNLGTADSGNKPVVNINWRDAIVWCNAYSEKNGKQPVYYAAGNVLKDSRNANAAACDAAVMDLTKNGYRLPTEAEREFAARGGDPGLPDWMYKYAGSDNIETVAWWHGNATNITQPVGTKPANRLGIFDLSGNVQEWGWDWMNYAADLTAATPAAGVSHNQTVNGINAGNQKPFNGGGVRNNSIYSAVVTRWGSDTWYSDAGIGFRVVYKAD
jgi:formylglycine-generating enzyme required for sulfatase activity